MKIFKVKFYDFFYILIIFINLNYIFSNEIQPELLEILYEKCKENIMFCSITEAIKYSFSLLKTDSKTFIKNNTDIGITTLKYADVSSKKIICEDVDAKIENKANKNISYVITGGGNHLVSFSKCTVEFRGHLFVENGTIIFQIVDFPSNINFDKINFYQKNTSTKGELNIIFEYDESFNETFDYDRTNPIFSFHNLDLTKEMDNILKDMLENYIYTFKSRIEIDENTLISQIKYLNEIVRKLGKNYSLLKPNIQENKNDITYIGYNELKYDSFINIKNKLFIPIIFVNFEYALNYNISYNEGDFIYENSSVSKNNNDDFFGKMINKTAEFNDLLTEEEKNSIWGIINNDFCFNFRKFK